MSASRPEADAPALDPSRPGRKEIEAIAYGVRDGTFPVARYHHREHVLATAWFVREEPELDLDEALPQMIRRYNLAMGGANTEDAGYHHTITMAYLQAIRRFLSGRVEDGLEDACAALLASPLGSKDFLLGFYSRERLFSREARREWIAPDVAALATDAVKTDV